MAYDATKDVLIKALDTKQLKDGRRVEAGIYSYDGGEAKLRVSVSSGNGKWSTTTMRADLPLVPAYIEYLEAFIQHSIPTKKATAKVVVKRKQ